MPGPELPDNEKSSRLVVSWRLNFIQSTMMKGMIENGAKQGLKDNYIQFSELLARNIRPVDSKDAAATDKVLSSVQPEQESDWKLAFRIFGNFTVVSSLVAFIYVFSHIILASPSIIQGLEFPGLDLPDSVGEVVVCGVLVLQGQRVLNMIARFIQAKRQRGSVHFSFCCCCYFSLVEIENESSVDNPTVHGTQRHMLHVLSVLYRCLYNLSLIWKNVTVAFCFPQQNLRLLIIIVESGHTVTFCFL